MTSDPGEKAPPRLPLSGATPPEPEQLPCPRCDSTNTKFCYFNNYNLSQPRHFCKSCRRYWTRGGSLRNVPVGGGSRKTPAHTPNKRLRTASAAAATSASPLQSEPVPGVPVHVITGLKSETAPSCVDVNLNETAAHEGESSFAPFLNTGDFGFGMGSGFRSMDLGPVWQMEGVDLSLLHQYLSYTPFSLCPSLSTAAAEPLLLRGCHPLPRRRCFAPTPAAAAVSLPQHPFSPLSDKALTWSNYNCKSFNCLKISNSNLGFDLTLEKPKFLAFKSDLDLPIPQFLQIAKTVKSPIRLGLDIGGGTGTFAAQMKLRNITIVTTTMNLGAPFSETVGLRGLVPLHVPLQQRLPVFDGVLDLVRCGRAVNRWIPVPVLEFLLYDVDRVLRVGGYLWVDRFFSKRVDFDRVYAPLFGRLGYKKVKWAVANKTDASGVKNEEVYLTALLQKPVHI